MVSYLDKGGATYLVRKMLDRIYPVGSLYFSTNSTSPAELYGGTWERYSEGRVLVGASDTDADFAIGKTGGSKEEKILNANVPSWVPSLRIGNGWRVGDRHNNPGWVGIDNDNNPGKPMNNLQPYIAVWIWHRVN